MREFVPVCRELFVTLMFLNEWHINSSEKGGFLLDQGDFKSNLHLSSFLHTKVILFSFTAKVTDFVGFQFVIGMIFLCQVF